MKKLIISLIATTVVFLTLCFTATGSFTHITVCKAEKAAIPEGTEFIELLVKEKEIMNYTTCNQEVCEKYNLTKTAEIVTLNLDEFVSYSYHRYAPKNNAQLSNENSDNNIYTVSFGSEDEITPEKFTQMRFACVDKNGEVLKITDALTDVSLMDKSYIEFTSDGVEIKHTQLKLSFLLLIYFILVIIEISIYLALKPKKKAVKKK